MSSASPKVVFDCVVFAQALINDEGPAGGCVALARVRDIQLVWSDYVLAEIRELSDKLPAHLLISPDRVEAFIEDVAAFAEVIPVVPKVFENPYDSDDSHYVDLAVASGAMVITSRDRHLLNLMDESRPQSREFRSRFPQIRIVTPDVLLAQMREQS